MPPCPLSSLPPALPLQHFPVLPPLCCRRPLQIVHQLTLRSEKAYPTGVRVRCSSLHGPGMVLIGDAAHGVTPRTGNGMTAALEDAQLLDEVRGILGGISLRFLDDVERFPGMLPAVP